MSLGRAWRRLNSAFRYESGELMGDGDPEPLSLAGEAPTWLLLHGYAGTPDEMRPLARVARAYGFAVEAPRLAGHGTHARDLSGLGFGDWLVSAKTALERARQRGPVLVVGQSLGALLGVQLALDAPADVLGLVLLANAFFLKPFPGWPLAWVDRLGLADFGVPKLHADIGDEEARAHHLTYSVQPVRPAIAVLRAGQRLFGELPHLSCPTLVVHGAKDRLCPVSNAWRVAQQLRGARVRVVILPRSHHVVTRDFEQRELAQEILEFAQELQVAGAAS